MSNWSSWFSLIVMLVLAMSTAFWPLRQQRWMLMLLPVLLSFSALAYWQWGAWPAFSAYQQQKLQHQKAEVYLKTIKGPQMLVQKLEAHLALHPKSAKGWFLLGRLYASQHYWQKALLAFAKAYSIKPKDEPIATNYAQSLLATQVDADEKLAQKVLLSLLQQNPNQMDALAMLAMDAEQHQNFDKALVYWQRLLALVPVQSEEADTIRKSILSIRSRT